MTKFVKHFFKKLRHTTTFFKQHKKITKTKQWLHKKLQQIQDGHIVQANLKEMRTLSKLLHHSQYGTTKKTSNPLELNLMDDTPPKITICKHSVHHKKNGKNLGR